MTLETINVDKICRTCLSEDNVVTSLFSKDETNCNKISLFEMLLSYTTVQISENDGLPSQVCGSCALYINKTYSFKQLCERSDETLRQVLGRSCSEIPLEVKPVNESKIKNESSENILNPLNEVINVEQMEKLGNIAIEIPVSQLHEIQLDVDGVKILESFSNVNYSRNLEERCDNSVEAKLCDNVKSMAISGSLKQMGDLDNLNIDADYSDVEPSIEDVLGVGEKRHEGEKMENVHKKDETKQPLFFCELCTSCFTIRKDLRFHLRNHSKANANKTKTKKVHVCQQCNQSFSSASTLCRHMKVHDGSKKHLCNECGKGFSRSDDLARHLRTHTGEKPYGCQICSKSFAQSFRLLEHMRAHANEKSFKCTTCGKAFSRYTSLTVHSKTHLKIKTHVCNLCNKRLCGSGSLAMHMKTHTGLKDHICNFCGKGFTTSSNLIIHKRTHTGERPYVCSTCGKAFPDPSRLTVHLRSHSGEKPYICQYCNHGCVSSSQLKKHVRIHTGEKPYKCDVCPKAFPRSEDLKIHQKTHIGYRDYICVYCNKGFYQSSTLKVHLRIHTGEKPYSCSICNKTFSQTGPLSIHMKSHNAQET